MEPIKVLKGISLAALIVAFVSVLQKLHATYARAWVFETGDTYDLLFRIALLVFAATWFGSTAARLRLANVLTSIALFSPCVMGAYNMIAIWFEEKNLVLNAWITICIATGLVLYVRFVWRWWYPRRTIIAGPKENEAR